mmetsp:Transcript_61169/g.161803  ORF Transcript_61169/g.161803 Transcript_61169/m.161803 type:complete len:267 (-) Transcript_61169:200-1000(-)
MASRLSPPHMPSLPLLSSTSLSRRSRQGPPPLKCSRQVRGLVLIAHRSQSLFSFGSHLPSLESGSGSMASASASGAPASAPRAASGTGRPTDAASARAAARRSRPAPMRRVRRETPSTTNGTAASCATVSLRASRSVSRLPSVAAMPSGVATGAAEALRVASIRGRRSAAISDALSRAASSSAVVARSSSSDGGGLSPKRPKSEEGVSMSAARSAWRVATSPSRTVSSTRMSCRVEPSLASSRLASSRAASAWPAPSRSTSAVAAV